MMRGVGLCVLLPRAPRPAHQQALADVRALEARVDAFGRPLRRRRRTLRMRWTRPWPREPKALSFCPRRGEAALFELRAASSLWMPLRRLQSVEGVGGTSDGRG